VNPSFGSFESGAVSFRYCPQASYFRMEATVAPVVVRSVVEPSASVEMNRRVPPSSTSSGPVP
jgi:hypothetical protein